MTDKQDPIAHAARLLREAAEELRQAHAYNNSEGWENETDAKAAYDEHLAAAQALEDWEAAVGAGGVSGPLMGIAAPPTAQAEGWRAISTAPRDGTEVLADTSGLGRVVVYWDDEESQWGTGLGYLDRGAPTHWMPLPPPPTSAEGVKHG